MPSSVCSDLAPAGDRGELRRVQRVERDVDPPHAGRVQRRPPCFASCVPLVVTVSSFSPPSPSRAPRLRNSVDHVAPHQRLAAGDADLVGAQPDEGGAEPVQLLQRQQVPLRQERHVLRHAVDAAKVAAVGDRNAEVGDGPAERIDHGVSLAPLCHPLTCAIPIARVQVAGPSVPIQTLAQSRCVRLIKYCLIHVKVGNRACRSPGKGIRWTGMSDSLRLAELLCARLCHDLSGPLGALIGIAGDCPRGAAGQRDAGAGRGHRRVELAQRLKLLRAAWGRMATTMDAGPAARLRRRPGGQPAGAAGPRRVWSPAPCSRRRQPAWC